MSDGEPEDLYPTLQVWMDAYEAEYEAGQTRISREEAERRFYERQKQREG